MKKYILFTNTKEKYHANALEFNYLCLLWEHLQEEFHFEEWYLEDVIKDFYEFLKDAGLEKLKILIYQLKNTSSLILI